jgi:hypothetical protein
MALEDTIKWKWTQDGQYTTQSAYQFQFLGRQRKRAHTPIWKAKAETKCRIFAWILLQHNILMADNLAKRNWPHMNPCVSYVTLAQRRLHTYVYNARTLVKFGPFDH